MLKQAPTAKTYQVIEDSETKFTFRIDNKLLNVPYCDSYINEDLWCVSSVAGNCNACCFRMTNGINFVKSTMFRGQIEKTTKATVKEIAEDWFDRAVKKRGL